MTLGVDISNFTAPLTTGGMQRLADAGVGLIIIQAFPPSYIQYEQQVAQTEVVEAFGMPWDNYVYDYFSSPGWRDGAADGMRALHARGLTPRAIWSDVEDVDPRAYTMTPWQRITAVGATLRALDLVPSKTNPTGVYSAREYWLGQWGPYGGMNNYAGFSDRPLWNAKYDGVADTDVDFTPYGGWSYPSIKQFRGTSTIAGIGGVDLDVLSVSEVQRLRPQEGPVNVMIAVGDGMKAQMEVAGDAPLCGHRNYSEVAQDGSAYDVEECYGSKGLYISSNASGSWVNAGPI